MTPSYNQLVRDLIKEGEPFTKEDAMKVLVIIGLLGVGKPPTFIITCVVESLCAMNEAGRPLLPWLEALHELNGQPST